MVSVVIPCKKIDAYVRRCIAACGKLLEPNEVIVVTDKDCPGYPALKRNWAMKRAKGNVYGFLDADAFPSENWLREALYWLQCYPAVCGPGVLPPDAPFGERIADLVYRWLPYSYRVRPKKPQIVAEYPTFNLIVRKEVATEFENYLTGEDSLFCRRIKGGIFYHPDILVYHNRRPAFRKLWKQVGTYGRHRGYLIRQAVLAWCSVVVVYLASFVKGWFVRRPS